ncbi:MAG: flagellar biosynthetic protein FliR [Syntrophomonas sp.]
MTLTMESFFFILGRITGLFLSAPIFSSRMIPGRVKGLVIIAISATMAYFVPLNYGKNINTPALFIAAMILEVIVGYTIGFVAYVVLATIQLAGQIMDMQMGFSIVNVVDPQSGTQIPLMGNFTQAIALLIYLGIDGHHYLLQALVQSFNLIPVLGMHVKSSFIDLITEITVNMFVIAVKISAPIVISILTSDIAMGFIARTVPQMNVFIVGLPLKILLGMVSLMLLLPVYLWVFNSLFAQFFTYVDQIILTMGL